MVRKRGLVSLYIAISALLIFTVVLGEAPGIQLVSAAPTVEWQYGTTGEAGSGQNRLYAPRSATRLPNGNTLIADTFNNRVIEVNPDKEIVWEYSDGLVEPANVSQISGGDLLIADSGANRVIRVNRSSKQVVWEYSKDLNFPQAAMDENGKVLIADSGNDRIIEVNSSGDIVWQYGVKEQKGNADDRTNAPSGIQLLGNGNLLVADTNNNRVMEIDRRAKKIVWQFGSGLEDDYEGPVLKPAYVQRLNNGNTLITDSLNNRVVIVDPKGNITWQYGDSDATLLFRPYMAERLPNGNILITDQHNHRVIEVTGPVEPVLPILPAVVENVYDQTVPGQVYNEPVASQGAEAGQNSPETIPENSEAGMVESGAVDSPAPLTSTGKQDSNPDSVSNNPPAVGGNT